MKTHFETTAVGEIDFVQSDLSSARSFLTESATRNQAVAVRLSNAYCVVLASKRRDYAELFKEGVTFPDGNPVVRVMRWRGARQARQVRGPSLFRETLDGDDGATLRHYFLGASEATLRSLITKARERNDRIVVAGYHSPPFGPLDQKHLAEWASIVRQSRANILWVSLGTPKQDFAAAELSRQLDIPVVAVGAAFDFYAETVREAPLILRRSGLEWLHRLVSEPRRLWRRYLIGNIQFMIIALSDLRRRAPR